MNAKHNPWSIKDFEFGRPLGNGRFGRVFLARETRTKEQTLVAVKISFKSMLIEHDSEMNFKREVEIQSQLNHPNVLRLFTWFHDEKRIFLVLEFCVNGNVLKELNELITFESTKAATYIFQTSNALKYLHERNIMHRDLKPENLLLGSFNEVKLADFGWCLDCSTATNEDFKLAGTLDYLPPEMIASRAYDVKIDNWCLGVLLYEFLVGKAPFFFENNEETYNAILNVKYETPNRVNSSARHLISKLLVKEPNNRLSLDNVLTHPWIQKNADKSEKYVKYFYNLADSLTTSDDSC